MKAQFLDLHAAADFLGPGAIEVNRYQTEITDIVRRRGAFGQRIKQVPATGHPSRFFEQTAIVSPSAATAFVDPRNIVATVGSPTRVERSLPLKALVSQINYNLFDMEVGAQQSQFAFLQAKDLADSVEGLMRTHDVALWNGNDTSLGTPTTTQYFGAIGQIVAGGNTHTVQTTESIVDGIKGVIAGMVANSSFEVRPTAIYANPASRENLVHTGRRPATRSRVGFGLHGNTGKRHGGASSLHRERRPHRAPLAHRCESARIPVGTAGIAGVTNGSREVRRSSSEGRVIRALRSESKSVRKVVGRWSVVVGKSRFLPLGFARGSTLRASAKPLGMTIPYGNPISRHKD